jgi:transcription antitermination factor NusB
MPTTSNTDKPNPGPKPGHNARTAARALALQGLYMLDVQGDAASTEARAYIDAESDGDRDARDYAVACMEGVRRMIGDLDAHIGRVVENWDFSRIAVTDRNIIRLALYEMTRSPDVPPKVAVNEAIELAKRFSTAESPRFVNGILDRLLNSNIKWELAQGRKDVKAEG